MTDSDIRGSQFPGIYDGLDVPKDFGFVMLDVEPVNVQAIMGPDFDEDDLFYSPTQKYIHGVVATEKAHITLLGGLLQLGSTLRPKIDQLLADWDQPESISIDHVGVFPSSVPGEDYSVIVGHVAVTDELLEGNARLRILPHVDYFPFFRPHLTLAYVKADATFEWQMGLGAVEGLDLKVKGLNYGD